MLKNIVAFALLGAGFFFILVMVMGATSGSLIDHTIQNSRQLLTDFRATAHFVDAFRQARNRLPSDDEIGEWGRDSGRFDYVHVMDPDDTNLGKEAVAKLGYPPRGNYLLGIWRGEWMEYYAPWSGKTTISFNKADYYMFGGSTMDTLLGGILAALSITGACLIWRKKGNVALNG